MDERSLEEAVHRMKMIRDQLRSALEEDTLADIIIPEPIVTDIVTLCLQECRRARERDILSCLRDCFERRLSERDDARGFADRLKRGESVYLILNPRKK